jgi:hypothetical protein
MASMGGADQFSDTVIQLEFSKYERQNMHKNVLQIARILETSIEVSSRNFIPCCLETVL